MQKVKYLIIGAGVSGLGFVNFLHSDDYLVLEKNITAGGYCRTIYKDDYIWDYAGHFFHFTNTMLKDFFKQSIKASDIITKKKNTKIYYNGKLIDYPFQKNIHQLPQQEFIDCLYDLFNKEDINECQNFEEMLYAKFGKSITDKFLKPYNEKLYACKLSSLDANAMGRFFPYADIRSIIDNMKIKQETSYNNIFYYPKYGAVEYIKALLKGISSDKISYNEEIQEIDFQGKIATTNKRSIKYDFLINTAPFHSLLKYIGEKIESTNILSYNKVLVFNMGFDKKSKVNDIHWIYFPSRNINFYRCGFYDNILDSDKLSIYVEIGYPAYENININQQLKFTLDNLREIGIIEDHKLMAYTSIIMDPAYIHISEKSNLYKDNIKSRLEQYNLYTIGRYGDWKYCSIEDSIIDAISLADSIGN